jgi:8-oxo-dGTP pyrophosphatase MutT (NUDIX family)
MAREFSAIRSAATIMLVRDEPRFQVLMVKRHHKSDFASSAYVFPGGQLHPRDRDLAWEERTIGCEGIDTEQRALRIAGVRELYEEAGILLARNPVGQPFEGCEVARDSRKAVMQDELPFLDLVRTLDLYLDLGALIQFARWITPDIVPKRFDTWFFLTRACGAQIAVDDGRETVEAEWIEPTEAVRLAASGERKIVLATRLNLQRLAEALDAQDAMARAAARPVVLVQPVVERRNGGTVVVISPDAGYGAVCEPLPGK